MQWKCPADRHVTAVLLKEREQSRAAAIAVSLLHRAKARHPALCFPAGVPTHLSTDLYTRTALNTPDSCGTDVSHSEILWNVFASSAIRGDRWRYTANFTLIWHVAFHLYKRPQHALAQHTGQRRRKTRIWSLLGWSSPYNPVFFYLFLWGDNISLNLLQREQLKEQNVCPGCL